MTYALRGACALAPHALAAPTASAAAMMTLSALEFPAQPFHDPFHAGNLAVSLVPLPYVTF